MIRPFAIVPCDDAVLVFDPATGAAHRNWQPLPTGRALMDSQQVTRWPEERAALSVRAVPELLSGPVLERAAAAGVVAVDLTCRYRELDADLVALTGRIRARGLLVTLSTDRPGLEWLAPQLAWYVDALRVHLEAPTEADHDRQARPGAAAYAQALRGVRAAVDAGIATELVVPVPPQAGPDHHTVIKNAAHRAGQLNAVGLTLVLARATTTWRSGTAGPLHRPGPRPAGLSSLAALLPRLELPIRVRAGAGRAVVPLHALPTPAGVA
ncbi:hypothetical protein ABTY61_37635 [Kitasatospora sp. NPDC096128]|uniref:hypothetical protein n=1 Tax=Kitasatospora sp. NPDC096128 TaxID=3155547 RepID=UPI0033250A91